MDIPKERKSYGLVFVGHSQLNMRICGSFGGSGVGSSSSLRLVAGERRHMLAIIGVSGLKGFIGSNFSPS